MTINYEGRVAVVTGGGAGLGRSHSLFLASRGAKVVVNDLGGSIAGTGGSNAAADMVVKEITDAGGIAVPNYNSVADEAGGQAIIQTALDEFGRIDILINNAGNNIEDSFRKMSMDDFRAVMDVHLMGSVYCTKAAWQHMLDQEYGRIIMTTSTAMYGVHGLTNYAAAKISLVGLMNSLALEGRKRGVTCNSIAPIALTRMSADAMDDKTGPLIKPEFVTAIVALLASEAHQGTGDVISAGAGYYGKIAIVEAEGVCFGSESAPSPDELASRFDEICDLSNATAYSDAFAAVGENLRKAIAAMKG